MEKFRVYGVSTKDESQRERAHRALARRAAADGMVLLKNNGVLPLKNKTIALYGVGARMTVKGGSGSGNVEERYSVTIEQGLKNAGYSIAKPLWLERFEEKFNRDIEQWRQSVEDKIKGYGPVRTMKMFDIVHTSPQPCPTATPILEDELTEETDTAVYVLARQAGEGGDRRAEKGDYLFSDIELESIRKLAKHYKKLLLVINCGSAMDLSVLDEVEVGAVLHFSQGGMEGGNAFADIVSGKVTPSGKLTATWGYQYADYPSSDTYSYLNGDMTYNNYYEGIHIGYRWFDAMKKDPRFPFGFGLSYTTFTHEVKDIRIDGTKVMVKAVVKNIGGSYSGREVLQLYLAKPHTEMTHEQKGLVAFAKTKLLAPGKEECLTMTFDMAEQGSYHEDLSAFVLEQGEYGLLVGTDSMHTRAIAVLTLDKPVILEKTEHNLPKTADFTEYKPEVHLATYDTSIPRYALAGSAFCMTEHDYSIPEVKESPKEKRILDSLSDKQMIDLCVGGGYSTKGYVIVPGVVGTTSVKLLKKGIPNINLSDGPAGLRVMQAGAVQKSGTVLYPEGLPKEWQWGYLKRIAPFVKSNRGRLVYQYMSAFPCETAQAQSWDVNLLEEIGKAVGLEMKEIGVAVWLAPGMNLHRNPLCGRNFEYYSEDPVLTGKMAAAITKGVQSRKGCFVTVKHFCCNNQEENRDHMSSNLSERALREMYLRPFRMVIAEAKPGTIMTSYNMVNGTYTPNSYDLCTKVLRNEWGFEGVIMSDWNSTDKCSHEAAINAGNDLIMPGNASVRRALKSAYKSGTLDKKQLRRSAARILRLILNAATSEGF
ncbi:MAG: hypothetical protein E7260_08100 [Lachnospiraceae bacterium]|nr:hypothetical protein [Lachnospiraceae bacterium]